MKHKNILILLSILAFMVHHKSIPRGVKNADQNIVLQVKKKSPTLFSKFYSWLCKKKKVIGVGTVLFYLLYTFFQEEESPSLLGDLPSDDLPLDIPDRQDPIHPEEEQGASRELDPQDVISLKAAKYLFDGINVAYKRDLRIWPVCVGLWLEHTFARDAVGKLPDGEKLCLIKDLKKVFLRCLYETYEKKKEGCREKEWFLFYDQDGCECIIPKRLLQLSEILMLKVKHAESFQQDSMKVDMCGLQLIFLLSLTSLECSYWGPWFCDLCLLWRDYVYPRLSELIANVHFYISDDRAQKKLYSLLACVYMNFYFRSTREEKEAFEKTVDPAHFHIFKWYIKRAYEQILLKLLIAAQGQWNFAVPYYYVKNDVHGRGFCRFYHFDASALTRTEWRAEQCAKYRLYCHCIYDFYNEFHEIYEKYCDDVGESAMVVVPNGIVPVLHRVSSLYDEQREVRKWWCDKGIDSYLEKDVSYEKGRAFPSLGLPCLQFEKFLYERNRPINLEEFWGPCEYQDFENAHK